MAFLGRHSGAGKSTLLKLIARLSVRLMGESGSTITISTRIPAKDIPFLRRNIGIVFPRPSSTDGSLYLR
ncbi:ATP-binding cassette domain-containing protein [Vibrio chagasii]|nr:ATP-binding cassette domain-containing protein [Vibrio chagasii]